MIVETLASCSFIHKRISFFRTARPIPRLTSARNRLCTFTGIEAQIILIVVRIHARICQTSSAKPGHRLGNFGEEDVFLVCGRGGQVALTSIQRTILGLLITGNPAFAGSNISSGIRYIFIIMVVAGEVVDVALRGGHVGADTHAIMFALRDAERDAADELLYLSGGIALGQHNLPRIIGDSHLLETAASGIHV